MRSHKYFILTTLIFVFRGFESLTAQSASQCLAVITEINGKALLKEAGMSQFVKATWGTQLFNGDQIATDDKSDIKLLYSDNSFVAVGPNSLITISGADTPATESSGEVRRISSGIGINPSSFAIKKDEGKAAGALAGVRTVTLSQAIELASPYNSLIKTDRPSFSWITKQQYDNFTVNLYNSKGLVWSRKVSEPIMNYPENEKGLEFGETYFWNVEGEYLINTDKSANHKFTVLTIEKSKKVEENETNIRIAFRENPESSSLHSVLGAYYLDQGLFQDAITEFQLISKINADAPLPHEILGTLYSDIGEKDKAIEELQKALMLTNNKER